MSIQDYKNINDIILMESQSIATEILSNDDIKILKVQDHLKITENINDFLAVNSASIEFYVYELQSEESVLLPISYGGELDLKVYVENILNEDLTEYITNESDTAFAIQLKKLLKDLLPNVSGDIRASIDFIKPILSTNKLDELLVYEISPTRLEARIKYIKADNTFDFEQKFYDILGTLDTDISISKNIFANFGGNNIFLILNILVESPDSIILRFYDPLPQYISEKDFCFICEKLLNSTVFSEVLPPIDDENGDSEEIDELLPNFNIRIKRQSATSSFYKNLDTLISGSNSTATLSFLSSSADILNVDFTKYENFIFYSSAEYRLRNFYHKLSKIEEYTADIKQYSSSISALQTSGKSILVVSNSFMKLERDRDNVIASFTPYEKYLYYESSSYYTGSLGEFFDSSWPKSNATKPYICYSISSSQVYTWYTAQLESASLYDKTNINRLFNTLPLFIKEDDANLEYFNFIDMISEYLDEVRLYSTNITNRNKFLLKETDGLSSKIVFQLIQQFGSDLLLDMDLDSIDTYFSLLAENDTSLNKIPSSLKKNILLKRYLNNLMFLLKSKGTENCIRTLAAMFGIDVDYYEIREYGGVHAQNLIFDTEYVSNTSLNYTNVNYSLNFDGEQNVRINWQDYE